MRLAVLQKRLFSFRGSLPGTLSGTISPENNKLCMGRSEVQNSNSLPSLARNHHELSHVLEPFFITVHVRNDLLIFALHPPIEFVCAALIVNNAIFLRIVDG